MHRNMDIITAAIDYMECHLSENLDLETVAGALHYSKYHLHRMFAKETGLTIHNYVQRRQLTEAARLLVFSDKPILEIALIAGYGSQQAFTVTFKEMYKKTPGEYRENKEFYPLQLRYILNDNPARFNDSDSWKQKIVFAKSDDILQWMDLVHHVVDGFPYLNEEQHMARLREYIDRKRAWILKDVHRAVGIMAFCEGRGSIDFLGIHPQYRKQGIEEAFLQKIQDEFVSGDIPVTVTTFREGDKADTGYRNALKKLGFAEGELLVEFGYPTQRFVLQKEKLKDVK